MNECSERRVSPSSLAATAVSSQGLGQGRFILEDLARYDTVLTHIITVAASTNNIPLWQDLARFFRQRAVRKDSDAYKLFTALCPPAIFHKPVVWTTHARGLDNVVSVVGFGPDPPAFIKAQITRRHTNPDELKDT